MDREIILSEALGLRASLGAIIRVAALVIGMTLGYANIRADLNRALEQGIRNEVQIETSRQMLDKARYDMNGVSMKLDMFFDSYNRDMNKYMRTDKDRR